MTSKNKNLFGFTLLELIIALSLLAILASVAVSRFVDMSKKTIEIQETATVSSLRTAVLLFKADSSYWPAEVGADGDRDIFLLLENPPPHNLWGIPPGDGKTWAIQLGGMGPIGCGEGYWIHCPHRLGLYPPNPSGKTWFYCKGDPSGDATIGSITLQFSDPH